MKNKSIHTLNMGVNTLKRNAEVIKFEGDNDQLFWRVAGEVCNPVAQLVIPETHNAVYVRDGVMEGILEGGRYPLFTVKKGLFGIKKVDAITLDILFISKTCKLKVLWGTMNPINARDIRTNIPVHIRTNGEFEVQVSNPRKFYLELVGADKNFTIDSLIDRLAARMLSYIDYAITSYMGGEMVSYIEISHRKRELSDAVLPTVSKLFEDDYGLKVYSFTIYNIAIDDKEVELIENELKNRQVKAAEKRDLIEILSELERLDDKEWERKKYLKELEREDYRQYLEVLKVIGWENSGSNESAAKVTSGHYCPECGTPYSNAMKFCNACGKQLPGGKKICSFCGNENDSMASFCSNCGKKI